MVAMTHNTFRYEAQIANNGDTRGVFNFPKLMSSINRKQFHNVDKAGNAQLYIINAKLGGARADAKFLAAPNTYYVKNAIKAWDKARKMMYRRAGIKMKDLGYGRTLKPYLDSDHSNGTTPEVDNESSAALGAVGMIQPRYQGDEWAYSKAAVAVPQEEESATSDFRGKDLVDLYTFHILSDSVVENADVSTTTSQATSDQDSWTSVGMVSSWLDSFKKRDIPTDSTDIDPDNPLLQLRSQQGADKEEVLELASSASKEGRPWDLDNSTYVGLQEIGFLRSYTGESNTIQLAVPCGLLEVYTANSSGSTETIDIQFDVVGIMDM